jgi:hypothetical protein
VGPPLAGLGSGPERVQPAEDGDQAVAAQLVVHEAECRLHLLVLDGRGRAQFGEDVGAPRVSRRRLSCSTHTGSETR